MKNLILWTLSRFFPCPLLQSLSLLKVFSSNLPYLYSGVFNTNKDFRDPFPTFRKFCSFKNVLIFQLAFVKHLEPLI